MASGKMIDYLGYGLAADKPVSPSLGTGVIGFWYSTDTLVLEVWDGSSWAVVSAAAAFSMPQVQILFPPQFKVVSGYGGSIAVNSSAGLALFNEWGQQVTAGNGDKIQTAVTLDAGTYDVEVAGYVGTNRGKVDWAMNGAAPFISGQDWYNGSAVINTLKTGTVTIATPGRFLLTATLNGKNGSSSDYYFLLHYIKFIRQTLTAG